MERTTPAGRLPPRRRLSNAARGTDVAPRQTVRARPLARALTAMRIRGPVAEDAPGAQGRGGRTSPPLWPGGRSAPARRCRAEQPASGRPPAPPSAEWCPTLWPLPLRGDGGCAAGRPAGRVGLADDRVPAAGAVREHLPPPRPRDGPRSRGGTRAASRPRLRQDPPCDSRDAVGASAHGRPAAPIVDAASSGQGWRMTLPVRAAANCAKAS